MLDHGANQGSRADTASDEGGQRRGFGCAETQPSELDAACRLPPRHVGQFASESGLDRNPEASIERRQQPMVEAVAIDAHVVHEL